MSNRQEKATKEFNRRFNYLYEKNIVTNTNHYQDYTKRLMALEMGLLGVLSPANLLQFQEEIDFLFKVAYRSYLAREDIDPEDRDRYDTYVEDAKKIQALAARAFAAARLRTNQKYEAVFDDDDKEEGGEVVYGPGGKVVGSGRRRYSVR